MTGYVQMHFAKAEREEIFGDKWSPDKLSGSWSRYAGCLKMGQSADKGGQSRILSSPALESRRPMECRRVTGLRYVSIVS